MDLNLINTFQNNLEISKNTDFREKKNEKVGECSTHDCFKKSQPENDSKNNKTKRVVNKHNCKMKIQRRRKKFKPYPQPKSPNKKKK